MTPYDVILVPFPFADRNSKKKRPALVLASFKPRSLSEHVIIAMMTSQIEPPHFPYDVILTNYDEAGLPKPTLVRLGKIVTLDSSLVIKQLGKLSKKDQQSVSLSFETCFKKVLNH